MPPVGRLTALWRYELQTSDNAELREALFKPTLGLGYGDTIGDLQAEVWHDPLTAERLTRAQVINRLEPEDPSVQEYLLKTTRLGSLHPLSYEFINKACQAYLNTLQRTPKLLVVPLDELTPIARRSSIAKRDNNWRQRLHKAYSAYLDDLKQSTDTVPSRPLVIHIPGIKGGKFVKDPSRDDALTEVGGQKALNLTIQPVLVRAAVAYADSRVYKTELEGRLGRILADLSNTRDHTPGDMRKLLGLPAHPVQARQKRTARPARAGMQREAGTSKPTEPAPPDMIEETPTTLAKVLEKRIALSLSDLRELLHQLQGQRNPEASETRLSNRTITYLILAHAWDTTMIEGVSRAISPSIDQQSGQEQLVPFADLLHALASCRSGLPNDYKRLVNDTWPAQAPRLFKWLENQMPLLQAIHKLINDPSADWQQKSDQFCDFYQAYLQSLQNRLLTTMDPWVQSLQDAEDLGLIKLINESYIALILILFDSIDGGRSFSEQLETTAKQVGNLARLLRKADDQQTIYRIARELVSVICEARTLSRDMGKLANSMTFGQLTAALQKAINLLQ